MAASPSSSKSMQGPISRCDTPSLVASTSERLNRYEARSTDFRYFTRSVASAALSVDVEKSTNPGTRKSLGEESRSRHCQRWTSVEDQQLVKGVYSGYGPPHDWKKIAADHLANTRSPNQCKARWKNALRPDINYGPFSAEEDNIILYRFRCGLGWSGIASCLPGRVAEQVRDRFVNYIDPSLTTSPWTRKEDNLLTELQAKYGNRWFYISMHMPGRSENSVKNRWHNRKTRQNRKLRREFAQLNSANSMPSMQSTNVQDSQQLYPIMFEDVEEDCDERTFCVDKIQSTDEGLLGILTKEDELDHDIYEI